MKRIYTDPRFPRVSIENYGGIEFLVMEDAKPVAKFYARERTDSPVVSEEFARKRADDYFDHMASMSMSAELDAQNWGSRPTEVTPLRKVTPAEVERAMAAARAEQDPVKKKAMEKRALRLMAREESLSEQTVSHLLYEL